MRTPVQRVGALTGFSLREFREDGDAFRLAKPGDGRPLSLDSEPGAAALCKDPIY